MPSTRERSVGGERRREQSVDVAGVSPTSRLRHCGGSTATDSIGLSEQVDLD